MSVDVTVDLSLYPIVAVMGTAYVFVDRCYVFLDKPAEGKVQVSLTAKAGTSEDELRAVAGEFQNELLSQALRQQIGERHERVRELLMARALFGAAPKLEGEGEDAAGLADELDDAFDDELSPEVLAAIDAAEVPPEEENDDYLDDPLGIAVSWEERFSKEKGADGKAAAPASGHDAGPAAPAASGGEATATPLPAPSTKGESGDTSA